jgi:hypothetical protein
MLFYKKILSGGAYLFFYPIRYFCHTFSLSVSNCETSVENVYNDRDRIRIQEDKMARQNKVMKCHVCKIASVRDPFVRSRYGSSKNYEKFSKNLYFYCFVTSLTFYF